VDEEKRISLVKRLEKFLDDQECYSPSPLVSLNDFFDGNDDLGSIGCNLIEHPGIEKFRGVFEKLELDSNVSNVWVIAKQHDWKPAWPFSDEIVLATSLPLEEIANRLSGLEPDEVYEMSNDFIVVDINKKQIAAPLTEKFIGAWWD